MARAGIDACDPRLASWLPGSEAEPPPSASAPAEEPSATPSVLTKLQKWANYEAMGSPVWPTNFIPMKTPMSNEILDNWSLPAAPRHPLTVPLLLARQAALGREVGLIIDLANHDCLYSDDMPESVEYEHVQLIAKVLPSREAINEVERIAKSFWAEHPSLFIAIHCAYGFNRTGFVVCSYLCQACGLTVDQALESFAAARPPGVKHEKFIRELHARYGGGPAVTPEGSVVGGSPPAAEALDGLAEEAERLRQAASAAAADGDGGAASGAAGQEQEQVSAGEEDGEPLHFEDAAYLVRLESQQRSSSLGLRDSAGSAQALPLLIGAPPPPATAALAAPLPRAASRSRTPSQPGSAASSRNPSRHGGSALQLDLLAAAPSSEAAAAGEPAEDAAIASTAGEGFAASRRLMQRKSSRGSGGGLSLALAASAGLAQRSAGSPRSSGSGATAGSPFDGPQSLNGGSVRTAQSSMSDFAAAAVHLEGASSMRRELGHSGSMRRTTSLGLAKALCEDFLQNNGTPGSTAPIAAAVQLDEEEDAERQGLAAGQAARTACPERAAAASQQLFRQGSGEERPGPSQQLSRDSLDDGQANAGAGSACEGGAEQLRPRSCSGASGPLSTSPSRRGGIPQPPGSRAQACCGTACSQAQQGNATLPAQPQQQDSHHVWQVSWQPKQAAQQQASLQQQQQQQLPGTPLTPGGPWSSGSLSKQPSASGFPRSVSVDSENPSLGFGMREALAHLRMGAAGGGDAAPHRGPQALADLFREDSGADVAALDASEHLASPASAAGERPPSSLALPCVVEASASAEEEAALGPGSELAAQQPSTVADCGQRVQEERRRPDKQRATKLQEPPVVATTSTGGARGLAGSGPRMRRGRHHGGDAKGKCRLM